MKVCLLDKLVPVHLGWVWRLELKVFQYLRPFFGLVLDAL